MRIWINYSPDIGIADIDPNRSAEKPGTGTANANKAVNSCINANRRADGQAAASDKTRAFLFFLQKTRFILISPSELETVSPSSFSFLLSLLNLIK